MNFFIHCRRRNQEVPEITNEAVVDKLPCQQKILGTLKNITKCLTILRVNVIPRRGVSHLTTLELIFRSVIKLSAVELKLPESKIKCSQVVFRQYVVLIRGDKSYLRIQSKYLQ